MGKVREALRADYKNFIAKYLPDVCTSVVNDTIQSIVTFELMRKLLIDLLGDNITEQEMVTLFRHFSAERKTSNCEREKVRSVVHLLLNRNIWDDMARLREHLYHLNPNGDECMEPTRLRSAIMACRLPLDRTLVSDMLLVYNTDFGLIFGRFF